MYLVKNPRFIIVDSIVLNCFPRVRWVKSVDDFYLVEFDEDASFCAAWNIVDFVSLYSYLDFFVLCYQRQLEVPAGVGYTTDDSASSVVDADVAFIYLVQTWH